MKIKFNGDSIAIYTSTNGHQTKVRIDHMVRDERCLGGHKVYIKTIAKGRPSKNPFRYVPINRIKFLS